MKQTHSCTKQHVPIMVGIDWSEQKYDVAIRLPDGTTQFRQINASTQQIQNLLDELHRIADGRTIAIAFEKARISLLYQLMARTNITLYLIDPKQFARYRESFSSAGAKHDRSDAALLLRLLSERRDQLRPFVPDDELTRYIGELARTRRIAVDQRTSLRQQLRSVIKRYFPLALELAGGRIDSPLLKEIIRRWPDPRKLRRLHPGTLRKLFQTHGLNDNDKIDQLINTIRSQPLVSTDPALIRPSAIRARAIIAQINILDESIQQLDEEIKKALKQHPDTKLFQTIRGAGDALIPRLIAAFGSQRDRYKNADEVAVVAGVAPVKRQSGKSCQVVRRRAASKFLLQTFHEFADSARRWCTWSRAYYKMQRQRGMRHHAALRKLASRWIRILYRVWITRTPYDEQRYLQALKAKNHPLFQYIES